MRAPFFMVSAVMELGAGLALLLVPAVAIGIVFGVPALDAAAAVGRIAGAALLSLAAACWSARNDEDSAAARALLIGMLTYNAVVVALVVSASLGPPSPLLQGVALLHGVMALWGLGLLGKRADVRPAR